MEVEFVFSTSFGGQADELGSYVKSTLLASSLAVRAPSPVGD